jgi:TrmH family RNA methyltransferase
MLLDGWHLIRDASDAGIDIVTVAVTQAASSSSADVALLERLAGQCDVFTVTTAVMNAMSPVRTPTGVVAVARQKPSAFGKLFTPEPALVVVAIDIQDPGNVGALIRSAEAGGATGVLLAGGSADPWGWKALRAAMGSTFRVPLARMRDTMEVMEALGRTDISIVATVLRGGLPMHEVEMRQATALVLGGEGQGLPDEIVAHAHSQLSIPMRHPVESLNVAVAAALLVYEARRQREA